MRTGLRREPGATGPRGEPRTPDVGAAAGRALRGVLPGLLPGLLVLVLAGTAAAQALPPFNTARLYLTEAEFTRAIQPYQQAIAANRQHARAHYWLGYAYVYAFRQWQLGAASYAAGYGARAVASLQEAIRLDETFTPAYLALHDAYRLMGQFDKADEVLAQMLTKARPAWAPRMPVW